MGYCAVPASTITVSRYIAYLSNRVSVTSIKQYLNIISILHKAFQLPNPLANNWYLDIVIKGVQRHKGISVKQKLPIDPYILLGIRSKLDLSKPSDMAFWAICLTMFFALLRKSHLLPCSPSKFLPDKHLVRSNIFVQSGGIKNGLLLVLQWSKTIQCKERQLCVSLPMLPGHPLCPSTAIIKVFACLPHIPPSTPAFLYPGPSGLSKMWCYTSFISKLRGILHSLGLNPSLYAGHSFRRGGASWALSQGVPLEDIKQLGDWKSDCYKLYLYPTAKSQLLCMKNFSLHLPSTF